MDDSEFHREHYHDRHPPEPEAELFEKAMDHVYEAVKHIQAPFTESEFDEAVTEVYWENVGWDTPFLSNPGVIGDGISEIKARVGLKFCECCGYGIFKNSDFPQKGILQFLSLPEGGQHRNVTPHIVWVLAALSSLTSIHPSAGYTRSIIREAVHSSALGADQFDNQKCNGAIDALVRDNWVCMRERVSRQDYTFTLTEDAKSLLAVPNFRRVLRTYLVEVKPNSLVSKF